MYYVKTGMDQYRIHVYNIFLYVQVVVCSMSTPSPKDMMDTEDGLPPTKRPCISDAIQSSPDVINPTEGLVYG